MLSARLGSVSCFTGVPVLTLRFFTGLRGHGSGDDPPVHPTAATNVVPWVWHKEIIGIVAGLGARTPGRQRHWTLVTHEIV